MGSKKNSKIPHQITLSKLDKLMEEEGFTRPPRPENQWYITIADVPKKMQELLYRKRYDEIRLIDLNHLVASDRPESKYANTPLFDRYIVYGRPWQPNK